MGVFGGLFDVLRFGIFCGWEFLLIFGSVWEFISIFGCSLCFGRYFGCTVPLFTSAIYWSVITTCRIFVSFKVPKNFIRSILWIFWEVTYAFINCHVAKNSVREKVEGKSGKTVVTLENLYSKWRSEWSFIRSQFFYGSVFRKIQRTELGKKSAGMKWINLELKSSSW